ncbi:hypothetical protein L7F22_008649 [Adiantum nelumboides]|nr:hypothetical protein [Adiantum nelumboides]
MDVVPKPSSGKTANVTEERKKKAPKVPEPSSSKTLQALDQGVPPSAVAEPEPCKPAVVTKEGKKGALKAQQPEQGLKIATPQGHDAPLSMGVSREPCQGAASKKAPKAPKVPKEIQPIKLGLNLVKGSGALKAQKSGQSKEMSDTACTRSGAPKTPKASKALKEDQRTKQVNKRKTKADVKEKEGIGVSEQHNVKRLKRMKEVGVCELAFERRLAIDEVKVTRHTGKGQLEKVTKVKIALKRDGMKKKTKKHVEKGLGDEESADKALDLVGSSKRPKLQVKRAKQSRASCIVSTTVRGSDDGGVEDDGSNQDGDGDDDSDDGSDCGSDISGDDDDKANGEDDRIDDEDDGGGSGKGDSESVSEQDDAQDVSVTRMRCKIFYLHLQASLVEIVLKDNVVYMNLFHILISSNMECELFILPSAYARSSKKSSSDDERTDTDKDQDSEESHKEDSLKGVEAPGPSEHERSDEEDTFTPLDKKSKKPRTTEQILMDEAMARVEARRKELADARAAKATKSATPTTMEEARKLKMEKSKALPKERR